MAAGKIKFVAIPAVLIIAGLLLPAIARVAASPQKQPDSEVNSVSQEAQNNPLGTQTKTPFANAQPGGREMFYKMLLSVMLVAALGIALIYVSKKLLPRIAHLPNKQIRVVETTYIAPRKGIHLVQIGARRLLIASTNENVTMLADLSDATGDFAPPTGDFAAELEKRS
jgi:flagellar biogenesis protein FliO